MGGSKILDVLKSVSILTLCVVVFGLVVRIAIEAFFFGWRLLGNLGVAGI